MDLLDTYNMRTYGWYDQRGILEPKHMEREISFTDKASYLEFVDTWKTNYVALTGIIRENKATCRSLQRDGDPKASDYQRKLSNERLIARGMLAVRKYAKIRSWAMKNNEEVLTVL